MDKKLKEIYRPIEKELALVEERVREQLFAKERPIDELSDYLLGGPGKRIRGALVIFSARAASKNGLKNVQPELSCLAAAVELIHSAALVHDDVIDHSSLRHGKESINARWSNELSIAFGDYLHSKAFELLTRIDRPDILNALAKTAIAMSEGELLQISHRGNFDISTQRYLTIVKKKTASLFACASKAGALLCGNGCSKYSDALERYGLNFGCAFQIADDYLDLVATPHRLGKPTGQDELLGDPTLPLLNLKRGVAEPQATLSVMRSFVQDAKRELLCLKPSPYKDSLTDLTDFITKV